MQKIITNINISYDFVNETIQMYEFYSEPYEDNSIDLFTDNSIYFKFEPIVKELHKQFKKEYNYFSYYSQSSTLKIGTNKNKAILCFSGGKDSVYTALKLKEKYDLTLYYLDGINGSYKDEIESAKECADKLNLPLIIEKVTLKGKTTFLENPLKNLVIYAFALNYGLPLGIVNYFFGNAKEDTVEKSSFDRNFSDSVELFDLYTDAISSMVGIEINNYPIIVSYVDSIIELGRHKELQDSVKSCLSPIRYRGNLHKHNEEKYLIKLPKNDCGSCWKCCAEYILWCDNNLVEYNRSYYYHCLDIIKKRVKDINSLINSKNLKDIYIASFGEDMYNISKLKGELND